MLRRLLLGVLGSVAEFERNLIRERQAEGIAAAKAKGVYQGRGLKLNAEQVQGAREGVECGVPPARVARGGRGEQTDALRRPGRARRLRGGPGGVACLLMARAHDWRDSVTQNGSPPSRSRRLRVRPLRPTTRAAGRVPTA